MKEQMDFGTHLVIFFGRGHRRTMNGSDCEPDPDFELHFDRSIEWRNSMLRGNLSHFSRSIWKGPILVDPLSSLTFSSMNGMDCSPKLQTPKLM